jgi:hypothetical protein
MSSILSTSACGVGTRCIFASDPLWAGILPAFPADAAETPGVASSNCKTNQTSNDQLVSEPLHGTGGTNDYRILQRNKMSRVLTKHIKIRGEKGFGKTMWGAKQSAKVR